MVRKATTLTNIGGVDLKEFQRQKALLTQAATQEIATRVESIRVLLSEIRTLAVESGVFVDIREVSSEIESIAELHPDWNSSSYYC